MDQAEVERLLMKPTAQRRLGKYVLLGRLGHGGMGKIYLAYLPGPAGIEKLLVIKRLHSHLTGDKLLVSSFLDEARLSMALNHPNIVHTYDVGDVEGRYFMVMEHIDGQNLGVVLRTAKRSGHYPGSEVWAGMFMQVLEGLHAAHVAVDARGRPLNIIHRDVSPQNVLVTYEGTPKLVDFGIAKAAMRIHETDAGVLKGKYAYMSPEQCEGHDLDPRSDVFSAGIVLWEMLAGRRLYKSDSVLRSVERILHEAPISPVKVNADCDPELANLVVKALQKKAEHRFASAEDFRDAIEETLRKIGSRFRKAEIRDLMHRCFEDVMRRQREVLDRCLAGDIPTEDPGDSESGHQRGFDGESASDLKSVAGISIDIEPTTPSSLRPSPLITGEGESRFSGAAIPGGPAAKTRAERPGLSPVNAGALAAVPTDAATAAFEAAAFEAPTAPVQPRSRVALVAAVVVLISGAATAGLVLTGRLDPLLASVGLAPAADPGTGASAGAPTQAGGERVASGAPAGTSPSGPSANAPPTWKEPAQDRADAPPAKPSGEASAAPSTGPGTAPPPAEGGARSSTRDDDDDDREAVDDDRDDDRGDVRKKERGGKQQQNRRGRKGREERVARADDAPARGDARSDERAREPEPSTTTSAARADAPPPEEAPRPEEPRPAPKADPKPEAKKAEMGRLTLQTSPWAEVYLKGKKLGDTPLVNVEVPAGELVLTLRNKEEGIEMRYMVEIRAGQLTVKKLGIQ